MKRFIVASASPRRRELLENAGFSFEIIPSDCDESIEESLSPEEAVRLLSERKAESVFLQNKDAVVLGCDTVVEYDGIILGKPCDEKEAFRMLSALSGRSHNVHTGVCIIAGGKKESFVSTTAVEFYPNSAELINSYISSKEFSDKAGGYGIQGLGSVLVKKIDGDYFTVVGLPLAETVRRLAEFGVRGKLG